MKQVCIVRKDLNMTHGKMAAQCSHAFQAYFTRWIMHNVCHDEKGNLICDNDAYYVDGRFPKDIFDEYLNGTYTKVVCEARNKNQLLKVVDKAKELGLKEGYDYFLIYDKCFTELTPEEEDGTTLTCIGFKPLPDDIAREISGKYHLYVLEKTMLTIEQFIEHWRNNYYNRDIGINGAVQEYLDGYHCGEQEILNFAERHRNSRVLKNFISKKLRYFIEAENKAIYFNGKYCAYREMFDILIND